MNRSELESLATQVPPQAARSYALANGWERIGTVSGGIALFSRAESELDQLIIPLHAGTSDYGRRMIDLAEVLAEFEQRPAQTVISDLMLPDADILRFRVSSPETERGDLPLSRAVGILEGAKKSLQSSACSVVMPEDRHHARLSRAESNQLLDSCRLRQTERGSFTVSVACPLRAAHDFSPNDGDDTPFVRRTTTLLMRSLTHVAHLIEADELDRVLEDGDTAGDSPVVTANLCQALVIMNPGEDQSASLGVSVNWAPTLPQNRNGFRSTIRFDSDWFPLIEDLYTKLRPSAESRQSQFVGYVDSLRGGPNDDGQVEGEVRFSLLHEEELIVARTTLDPKQYDIAVEAHRRGKSVKLSGLLKYGQRLHRITNVTDLEFVTPLQTENS